jgi:hypothetical protein
MFPRKRLPGFTPRKSRLSPGLAVKSILDMMAIIIEEKERVMEAFRRWGYLEAELDPVGCLHLLRRQALRVWRKPMR